MPQLPETSIAHITSNAARRALPEVRAEHDLPHDANVWIAIWMKDEGDADTQPMDFCVYSEPAQPMSDGMLRAVLTGDAFDAIHALNVHPVAKLELGADRRAIAVRDSGFIVAIAGRISLAACASLAARMAVRIGAAEVDTANHLLADLGAERLPDDYGKEPTA